MSREAVLRSLALALPFSLMAACGGGGSVADSSSDSSTPAPSSPTQVAVGQESNAPAPATPDIGAANSASTSISGRVADGYLRGAVVCVDANENGQCDEGEPRAISGEGGQYTLDVPAELEGFPIVAAVPETAIDEDTGQAIGKQLVLSAPGDRPEFVSPITTLVQQEMQNNPALDITDAEATVLESLGLPDEAPDSLFQDYIADSETDDTSKRERARHLHQTARVVASMMDEIRSTVEASAVESGVDVSGDDETRKAIRQLVREEVRKLLPEISNAVADRIVEIDRANEFSAEANLTAEFNPDSIADSLQENTSHEALLSQIEAVKTEKAANAIDMQALLQSGFYIIDMECDHGDDSDHYGEREDGIEDSLDETMAVVMNDEGVPQFTEIPAYCYAFYQQIQLDDSDNSLMMSHYEYDHESNSWLELQDFVSDEAPHLYMLQGSEWQAVVDDGPAGVVEFTESGGAILSTGQGKILVHATSRDLSDTAITRHLFRRGAGESMLALTNDDENFPADSHAYRLSVKRRDNAHVLFNWAPHDDGSGENHCAEFNNNCNVVDMIDEQGFIPVTTLAEIREHSIDGLDLREAIFDDSAGRPIDLRLTATDRDANGSGESGTATWMMPAMHVEPVDPFDHESPDPFGPSDTCFHPDIDGDRIVEGPDFPAEAEQRQFDVSIDTSVDEFPVPVDTELPDVDGDGVPDDFDHTCGPAGPDGFPDAPDHLMEVRPDADSQPALQAALADEGRDSDGVVTLPDTDHDGVTDKRDLVIGISKWHVVEVNGIEMIEIAVPVAIRHRIDIDELASLLLIEHDGYVRRGARLSETSSDQEIGYSIAAFETLLPIVEKHVSQ